jgi:hypothetical protein
VPGIAWEAIEANIKGDKEVKIYQFINRTSQQEYLTFVDDEDPTPISDYLLPGFELYAEARNVDMGMIVPGEGDIYKLDR